MTVSILIGDCRSVLPTIAAESVHCVMTSPPYFRQRDYGVDGQIGQEATPADLAEALCEVSRELRGISRAVQQSEQDPGPGRVRHRPPQTVQHIHP